MTHVWPTADSFTAGTHAYGDYLGQYLKCAFWVSKNFAHPAAGTYVSTQAAGDLNDLYSPTGPSGLRYATPLVAVGAYLWRALESASDTVVTLGFSAAALSGGGYLTHQSLTHAMVAARVTGSTYTSASNKHENAQDGYFFGVLNTGALFATWYLARLNAGTLTILQSRAFTGTSSLLTNELDPFAANEIALEVTASGGDVRLQCTLRTPSGGSMVAASIFDYTDTSGSKITAAGRHGFSLNGKLTVPGSPGGFVAGISTFFQIEASGSVVVRDEWSRAYGKAGLRTTDTIGTVTYAGNSMLCGWAGDFFTVAAYDKKIRRSAVGGLTSRINFDPVAEVQGTGTGEGGFLASLRRATDKRSQNRSAQVRFSTLKQDGSSGSVDPTPNRMAGIFVRGATTQTPSTTFVLSQGYLAVLAHDDALATTDVLLIRYRQGAPAIIARKNSVSVSVDTDYTLRLDAFNLKDSAGTNIGAPILRVFLDGVQVVLVTTGAQGIEVGTGGTVKDGASTAIIEGPLEGLYAWIPNGNRTIFLDTWAEGTLTNSLETAPADQASIAVPSELDDDSGEAWSVPIEWGFEEIVFDPAFTMPFESGHVQTNRQFSVARRAWRVHFDALTDDERDELLDLWAATDGVVKCFDLTIPQSSETVKARFVDSNLGVRLRDVGVNAYGPIEIEEALA